MNHPEAAPSSEHNNRQETIKSPIPTFPQKMLPSEILFTPGSAGSFANKTFISMSTIGDDDSLFDSSPLVVGAGKSRKKSKASGANKRAMERLRAQKSDDSGTLSLLQQLSMGLINKEDHRTNRDGTTFFCRLNDEEAARQRREKRNSATPIVKPTRKKSGEIIRPPARPSDFTSTTADLTSDIEDDDECYSDCEESLQGNFYDTGDEEEDITIADDTIVEDQESSFSNLSLPSAPTQARWSPNATYSELIKKPTRKCSIGYSVPPSPYRSSHSRSGRTASSIHSRNNNIDGSSTHSRPRRSYQVKNNKSSTHSRSGRSATSSIHRSIENNRSTSSHSARRNYTNNNHTTSTHSARRSFARLQAMDFTTTRSPARSKASSRRK